MSSWKIRIRVYTLHHSTTANNPFHGIKRLQYHEHITLPPSTEIKDLVHLESLLVNGLREAMEQHGAPPTEIRKVNGIRIDSGTIRANYVHCGRVQRRMVGEDNFRDVLEALKGVGGGAYLCVRALDGEAERR